MSKATRIEHVRRVSAGTARDMVVPMLILIIITGTISVLASSPTLILITLFGVGLAALILIILHMVEIQRIRKDPMP